ncbi:MAG TPA: peptidase [Nitrospiraceae bacterium]|jgi:serine protease Do|nr:peptidase [Nitrospiraceae bacterium]
MKLKSSLVFPKTVALLVMIAEIVLLSSFSFHTKAYAEEPAISKNAVEILSKISQAMVEIVAAAKPGVVNISSTQRIKTPGVPSPFFNDPLFRKFFGDEFGYLDRPREYTQASLGSGVIVDKDGYILTNNHVVQNADEIKVKLSDKREFKGRVIGADSKTDLAVIKIDSNNLPAMKFGDSDRLKVGETVIAIGNPYGLSQTVTSGIVSATGRANVGIADYEDFIQTDAAINPGNSGGALVNVRGQLIGINTAIFSTSGGYQGIGFAIPSSMAKAVMENLIKKGKVVRGWMGLSVQPVTPDLAKQFKITEETGALVNDVTENGPAEKGGIRRGDVIVAFNGKEIDEPSNLRSIIANTPPGKVVTVKILRAGRPHAMNITIAELPADRKQLSGELDNLLKGVHVQSITPELQTSLAIPKQMTGVVISSVDEDSPANEFLAKNDVILEVDRKRIQSTKDYEAVVSQITSDQNALLLIFRNGATIYLTLSPR